MSATRSTGFALFSLAALAASALAQAPTPPAAPPAVKPAFEAQVVTAEAVHAVVLPMKGSYMQHQQAFERLGGFLAGRGVAPSGPPFGRYFSDPAVGEANLVWEVGFPIAAGVTAEAPFEIRDLPATQVVVHVHRGPMEELGTAWSQLVEWVFSNGYQVGGPATQVFKGDLAAAPEVEMRLPVTK
jgi:effector-binding domain-containing protein